MIRPQCAVLRHPSPRLLHPAQIPRTTIGRANQGGNNGAWQSIRREKHGMDSEQKANACGGKQGPGGEGRRYHSLVHGVAGTAGGRSLTRSLCCHGQLSSATLVGAGNSSSHWVIAQESAQLGLGSLPQCSHSKSLCGWQERRTRCSLPLGCAPAGTGTESGAGT